MPDAQFVKAYNQVTGEARDVPEHWIGEGSPFPGRWGKSAPAGSPHAVPAQSASKGVWVDYVVGEGFLSREDADVLTKTELIDHYGQEG